MSLRQIGGNFNFDKISGVWDLEDQIYVNKTIGQIEKYSSTSTASKFWPTVETTEQSFVFDGTGTKALLAGLGDNIYQFKASVPFDPSTLTKDIDTFSLPNNPTAITFGNSGNFLYTSNSTTIYQYTCVNGPYDITNLSLTNTLTAQANTTGAALVFKSDGSRLFTINGADGIVHSYTVGNGVINQWNLSAATYDSVKKYTHFNNNITSLTFSSDGTKMYLGDNNTNNKGIIKYNLSVAWDATTASNAVDVYDLSISSATNSTGTTYGDSGNKLYVMRDDGQVTQLNLGTPYRGNNVSSFTNKTTQADSKTTGYKGLYFKSDGLKYWTINNSGGNLFLYQFALSAGWNISGATYDSKSIDLSTQLFDYVTGGATDNDIKGVAFNDAGTKLYLLGIQRDFLYELDLETAWDITTANFQVYKSPLIEPVAAPNHCDVTYGNSGSNLYVVISNAPARIQQYDLTTPFNIRRLTNPSKSKDISAQTTAPKAVRFNSTGTKMFVLGTGASTATVYQYTLTAWDVSTATYDSVSFSVYTQATDPRGLAFKDDGTKMYIANRVAAGDDVIYQYNVPTGFDLASSVTYDSVSLNIAGADTEVGGIILGNNGTRLYVTGSTNDNIRQYNLPTAWVLTGGTLQTTPLSISSIYVNPSGIDFSSDGKTVIVSGGDGATLYSTVTAFRLPTAWDISTFAVKRRSVQTSSSGLTIGDSDDEIYHGDNTTVGSTAIQRLDLTTPGLISGGATATTGYTRAYGTTIEDVSISGNGSYLAYVSANKLYVLNLTTAYDINTFTDDFYQTGYTSNALQISSDGTNIYNFYDVSSTRFLYRYPLPTPYDVDSISTSTSKNTNSLTHLLEDPTTSKVWSDIFLSPDGNSLYILDASSYQIAKLKFGTAYDESTLFSYFQSFVNPKCIRFNSTGTSLFILSSTSTIVQWSLPTAFDILKYTNLGSLSVAIDNDSKSFTVSPDSSRFYVLGDETNKIFEYRMKTPNDITTGYYFDRLNLSGQVGSPQAVSFGDSGRKVYVLNSANDTIYQYTIPVQYDAWDIKNAVYDNKSFSVNGIDTDPQDIRFMPDGKSFIMLGLTGIRLLQVYVETAWDISTAWYNKTKSISVQDVNGPSTISFGDSGKKMYAVGRSSGSRIYQYSMPLNGGNTTWDISGSTYDNKSYLLPENSIVGAHLNPSSFVNSNGDTIPAGTRLLMMGDGNNAGYQRNLSTPWDISTAYAYKTITDADYYDISSPTVGVLRNLRFGGSGADQGKKLYILGDTRECIIQYALSTAYDLNTATYLARYDITGQNLGAAALTDIHFNDTGTKVYVADDTSNRIFELRLSTAWDITTARFIPVKIWPNGSNTNASGITFNSGEGNGEAGKKLYVSDYTNSTIYQYQLSTAWDVDTITNYATSKSVSVSSLDANIDYVELSSDGTRIYFGGVSSDRIFERKLTVPYEISSASNVSNLTLPYQTRSFTAQVSNATAFTFGSNSVTVTMTNFIGNGTTTVTGTVASTTGFQVDDVISISGATGTEQAKLNGNWRIASISTGTTFTFVVSSSVTAGTLTTNLGTTVRYEEGKKLYVLCNTNDRIYQYTLSTAWDVSTATYDNKSFLYANEATGTAFDISKDGEKLYIIGTTADRIYQYSLTTPWDISTGSYDNKSLLVSSISGTMNSLKISSASFNSKIWFTLTDQTADDVFIAEVTPQTGKLWGHIDTATQNTSATRDVSAELTPTGVAVAYGSGVTEGTVFYVVGTSSDTIRKYTSSTAWTGSWSLVSSSDLNINFVASVPEEVCVSKGGDYIYVLDSNIIYRFTMETAHESKTANIGSFLVSGQDTAHTGLRFSSDGTKMFTVGNLNDDIFRYNLTKAWVASSATFVSSSAITIETNTYGFDINNDGTKYYAVGSLEIVRQYIPSVAFGTTLSTSTTKDIEWIMTGDAESIKFSNDGLRVFIADATRIYQFNLDAAFDIASLNMGYYNVGLEDTSPQAMFINPTGTRMIVAGTLNDTIRTYTLTYPYNISSATLTNTSPTMPDGVITGISFNSDGSKFYTIGQGTTIDAIRQFNATNYSITSATVVTQVDLVNYSNPLGMCLSHTGKQLFMITSTYDILQIDLDSAFNINSLYIDQITQSVDVTPSSFFVNKEGTNGLFFGSSGDNIKALTFTYNWNINSYTNSSTQSTVPGGTVTGIWWSDDGTQVLMADQVTDKIHRYTFSSAWNVTTISSTNSTKTYNLAHDLNPYGLAFNDDGTMMYYIDSAFVIKQIPLKTAHFPDTAYSGTLIVSGQDAIPKSFCINSTGSRLFLLGQNNDDIFRYDFGENYSVATLAYATSSVDIGTRDLLGTGLECNSDASKFWLVGGTNDTIYQLSNSTPNALGTLSLDTSYATARVDTTPNGLRLSSDGMKLYFTGFDTDSVYQINLATANTLIGFDDRSFSVASQSTTCRALTIDKDGKYLYMYGDQSLFQYNITSNAPLTSATYSNKFLYVGTAVSGPVTPIDFSMSANGYYFYLLDQNLDNVKVYRTALF